MLLLGLPGLTWSSLFRLVMLSYFSWDLNMATACYTAELLLPFCLETQDLKAVTKRYHCFQTLKMELLRTVKEVITDTG